IRPVFSQYARTFLRKSNEYAINTLYHKCTVFVSFNYTLKKKNQIKYARQKCPVESQNFSINLNHQQKEIK
ncbi:hypothetical protein RFK22_11480, partial [Streptococcus suis]|uniref:hypothetical protein n=1 Tax=Streptococcus suis TaxID=1307 RepID=UPI002FC759E9